MDSAHLRYLYELVSSLSSALDTSVELTDAQLQTIARADDTIWLPTSAHAAINLNQFGQHGTAPWKSAELIQVPAVEALGIPALMVIPLRVGGDDVAFLWLADRDGRLTPGHVEHARRAVQATVSALNVLGAFDHADYTTRPETAGLLADDLPTIRATLDALIAAGRLTHDDRFWAVAIDVDPRDHHFTTVESIAVQVAHIGNRLADVYPSTRRAMAHQDGEGVVLYAPFPRDDITALTERLSSLAQDLLFRAQSRRMHRAWLVGTSSRQDSYESAPYATLQARRAVRLGERLGWQNRVADWHEVKHVHGFATLPAHRLETGFISPRLQWFLDDRANVDLVRTLECFLDNAGNIKTVAATLYLHRATVYYRLRRIEELLGIDLANGHDRLHVHMGLVSWQLLHS